MKEYSTYYWIEQNLYQGERKTKISIIPARHPNMYHIKFEDGSISEDFYNLDRVKDNAVKYAQSLSGR